MLTLNNENYYSIKANEDYWSVSQFKAFDKCEAAGLAEAMGEYTREETDALLIGSYVDAVLAGGPEETRQFVPVRCDFHIQVRHYSASWAAFDAQSKHR